MANELILVGTTVLTLKPNLAQRRDISFKMLLERKWGVAGLVISCDEGRYLIYTVQHRDGSIASYVSSELEVLEHVDVAS